MLKTLGYFLLSISSIVLFQAENVSAQTSCVDATNSFAVGNQGKVWTCANGTDPNHIWLCENLKFKRKCPEACGLCGDSKAIGSVTIGTMSYSCSDAKPWLCNNDKFKNACPGACGNDSDPTPTDCADSSEEINVGKKGNGLTCSDGTDPSQDWLCKSPKFKKHCPVTCDACGKKGPGKKDGDGIKIKKEMYTCSDASSNEWLCKHKKFNKACTDECNNGSDPKECTDSSEAIKMGKKGEEIGCSDATDANKALLCKKRKFKKSCPVTCDACGGPAKKDDIKTKPIKNDSPPDKKRSHNEETAY